MKLYNEVKMYTDDARCPIRGNMQKVLVYLSKLTMSEKYFAHIPLKKLANDLGVTTRTIGRIINDLNDKGYLIIEKKHKWNYYLIRKESLNYD